MSVTMGNAIRQLKLEISGSDIDLPEQDVRSTLLAFAYPVTLIPTHFTFIGKICALWKN